MVNVTDKESSKVAPKELLDETKKKKTDALMNGVFIGFLIGIVIYSVAANSVGFFTLIPLFLIYKLVNRKNKA